MSFGPPCPNCGTRVPFLRTQWGLGKPFACAGCAVSLVFSRTYLGLAPVIGYWLGRDYVHGWAEKAGLLAALLVATLLAERALVKPRLAA